MKKIILISVIIIALGVAAFVIFKQSSTPPQNPPAGETRNFNLIFRYGVGAKNELNTFNQTYTKDMVIDEPITIKMELSDDGINNIYQKLNELNLFNESRAPKGNMMVTPCVSYYLKVQIDSEQKEMSWDNCQGEIADKLEEFSNYIIQIIESHQEYKRLPTPQGGYL